MSALFPSKRATTEPMVAFAPWNELPHQVDKLLRVGNDFSTLETFLTDNVLVWAPSPFGFTERVKAALHTLNLHPHPEELSGAPSVRVLLLDAGNDSAYGTQAQAALQNQFVVHSREEAEPVCFQWLRLTVPDGIRLALSLVLKQSTHALAHTSWTQCDSPTLRALHACITIRCSSLGVDMGTHGPSFMERLAMPELQTWLLKSGAWDVMDLGSTEEKGNVFSAETLTLVLWMLSRCLLWDFGLPAQYHLLLYHQLKHMVQHNTRTCDQARVMDHVFHTTVSDRIASFQPVWLALWHMAQSIRRALKGETTSSTNVYDKQVMDALILLQPFNLRWSSFINPLEHNTVEETVLCSAMPLSLERVHYWFALHDFGVTWLQFQKKVDRFRNAFVQHNPNIVQPPLHAYLLSMSPWEFEECDPQLNRYVCVPVRKPHAPNYHSFLITDELTLVHASLHQYMSRVSGATVEGFPLFSNIAVATWFTRHEESLASLMRMASSWWTHKPHAPFGLCTRLGSWLAKCARLPDQAMAEKLCAQWMPWIVNHGENLELKKPHQCEEWRSARMQAFTLARAAHAWKDAAPIAQSFEQCIKEGGWYSLESSPTDTGITLPRSLIQLVLDELCNPKGIEGDALIVCAHLFVEWPHTSSMRPVCSDSAYLHPRISGIAYHHMDTRTQGGCLWEQVRRAASFHPETDIVEKAWRLWLCALQLHEKRARGDSSYTYEGTKALWMPLFRTADGHVHYAHKTLLYDRPKALHDPISPFLRQHLWSPEEMLDPESIEWKEAPARSTTV